MGLPIMVLFNIILLVLVSKVRKRNEYKERKETVSIDVTKKESIHKVEN